MRLYRYVNGHVLYTENSPELDDQFMKSQIVNSSTCKNCGLSGDEIFDGDACPLKHFQTLDRLMEKTYYRVEEAECIVKQAKINEGKGV